MTADPLAERLSHCYSRPSTTCCARWATSAACSRAHQVARTRRQGCGPVWTVSGRIDRTKSSQRETLLEWTGLLEGADGNRHRVPAQHASRSR